MDLIDNPQLNQILDFIDAHEQENPAHLLLSNKIPDSFPKQAIAEQIAARKKAQHKLPEFYNKKGILFPPAISMEQCSSEATARFKGSIIKGNHLVDLTGGFGIDTFYMSKNFSMVDYIEQQSHLCKLAEHNFKNLGTAHKIKVHHGDGLTFINSLNSIDYIYVDPARRDKNNHKVFGWQDCQPNLVANLSVLLTKAQTILAKAAPMLDISKSIQELQQQVKEVHIVEWKGEVRELLFIISRKKVINPKIQVNILSNTGDIQHQFMGHLEEEKEENLIPSMPLKYLYEPSPAMMKSGLFNSLGKYFKLKKLHTNTHLFTSEELVNNFPGKTYLITAVIAPQKKILKKILPDLKANLKCRNFPMPIEDLKKKLSMKDGGNTFIFAASLFDQTKNLLICTKVDN